MAQAKSATPVHRAGVRRRLAASAVARDEVTCLFIEAESLRSLLEKQSPILAPMFEALLLQQSMHNVLRRPR